jgi:hypothetical protein
MAAIGAFRGSRAQKNDPRRTFAVRPRPLVTCSM